MTRFVAQFKLKILPIKSSIKYLIVIFRLDRLFVLLESGSTPGTRKAAATQLGEVQRLHPHELPFILSRVHKCLRSTSWETRVAAGLAVEAILSKVPAWNPLPAQQLKQEVIKKFMTIA